MVRDIQLAVAQHYKLPLTVIASEDHYGMRKAEWSHPRQLAMLLSRKMTKHSKTRIGHLFSRDHSTIIHGIHAARRRCLADNKQLKALFEIRASVLENAR